LVQAVRFAHSGPAKAGPLTKRYTIMNTEKIAKAIQSHGWLCQHVTPMPWEKGKLGFSYTIGLFEKFKQPEIMVIGYEQDLSYRFLRSCYELVSKGQNIVPDVRTKEVLANDYDVVFKNIRKELYPEQLGIAVNYYGHTDFPALVIFWPDKNNLFPWEAGYDDISQEQELSLV
jgi:hypothetical protein